MRCGMPREYDVWELANRVLGGGWSGAGLPELLAERRTVGPAVNLPAATALRAIRAEVLAPLTPAVSRAALTLVNDYVPAPGLTAGMMPLMDDRPPLLVRLAMLASDPARAIGKLRSLAQRLRLKSASQGVRDG
jgi:hypothetical protein